MADEKKPKIDLKARLGKAQTATPPPTGAVPPPISVPPPPFSNRPSGAAPGIPVGPTPFTSVPPLDPSNPLSAAISGAAFRTAAPQAPPQPMRIEVDDSQIKAARSSGFKTGAIVGGVAAVVFAGIGFIAGGSNALKQGRAETVSGAKVLAGQLDEATGKMKKMSDALEAGTASLKAGKFPDTLVEELGTNVNFGGNELAVVRVAFPADVTTGLFDVITSVQSLNDKRIAVQSKLNQLKKPITEQLAAAAGGKRSITHAVVLGERDGSQNFFAQIVAMNPPLTVTPPNVSLPDDFNVSSTRGAAKLPRYKGGELSEKKVGAMYISPETFKAACPSEQAQAQAQLVSILGQIYRDLKGEKGGGGDVITEGKTGLIEKAEALSKGLKEKVK